MGKSAQSKATGTQVKCVVCRKVSRNRQVLCQYCRPKLDRICDPDADDYNQQLAACIQNTKKNCRPGLANKLVKSIESVKKAKSEQISKRAKSIRSIRDKYRYTMAQQAEQIRRGLKSGPKAQVASAGVGSQGFKPKKVKKVLNKSYTGPTTRYRSILNINDQQLLKQLLVDTPAGNRLSNLNNLVNDASDQYREGDRYSHATKVFCDGFEIILGRIDSVRAGVMRSALLDSLQRKVCGCTIKNLAFIKRPDGARLWVTLSSDDAWVDGQSLQDAKYAVEVVKAHAERYWGYTPEDVSEIKLTKFDSACDMRGSFMPTLDAETYETLRSRLSDVIDTVFQNHWSNFLSLYCDLDLKVVGGNMNVQ